MDPIRAVVDLARRGGGLLTVRQAVEAGMARSTFDDLVHRQGWPRVFPGVVALPGTPLDAEAVTRAAAMAVDPHAVITGESALHLAGILDRPPVRIDLVVPAHRRAHPPAPVRVRRSRTLETSDATADRAVLVATPPRAFLDAASRAGVDSLRSWLIDGRQRRLLDVAEVATRAACAVSSPGRGRLLAASRDVTASGADSGLVAEIEGRLRVAGFDLDVPPRTVAVPGRVLHPDITIAHVPVAIEVDGRAKYDEVDGLDLDQREHNAYRLAGWWVLRIGRRRLSSDWPGFVAELRRAVEQAT